MTDYFKGLLLMTDDFGYFHVWEKFGIKWVNRRFLFSY